MMSEIVLQKLGWKIADMIHGFCFEKGVVFSEAEIDTITEFFGACLKELSRRKRIRADA